MSENFVQREATGASLNGELLKVLVDKTVDNGTAISQTQEMIRKLNPDAAMAGMDQRMALLEERVGLIVGERTKELAARIEVVGKGVDRLTAQVGEPSGWLLDSMQQLRVKLEGCIDFFSTPMRKEVHHRHILGWPVLVLFGMLLIAGVEWMELSRVSAKADRYEKNDVLWRAARLSEDSVVTRALDQFVRDYDGNPEQYGKDVVAEEERRVEVFEQMQRVNRGMGRIHDLEKQKKTPGK